MRNDILCRMKRIWWRALTFFARLTTKKRRGHFYKHTWQGKIIQWKMKLFFSKPQNNILKRDYYYNFVWQNCQKMCQKQLKFKAQKNQVRWKNVSKSFTLVFTFYVWECIFLHFRRLKDVQSFGKMHLELISGRTSLKRK